MKTEEVGIVALLLLLFASGSGGEPPNKGPDKIKPPPQPDPGPEPVEPVEPTPEVVDPPIDEITNTDWPVPGHFYVVRPAQDGEKGDTGLRIAKRALADAAFRAAKEFLGASDDGAREFAKAYSSDGPRQYAYLDKITCESWNDATVTTYGYGDKARAAPLSGRAIRLLPQHADNLSRLRQGKRAVREMHFGKSSDRTNGVRRGGGGDRHETLYLPGVDLAPIIEGKLAIGGGTWPDGSSKAHPPKWVLDLGVRDRSKSVTRGNLLRGCGDKVKVEVVR